MVKKKRPDEGRFCLYKSLPDRKAVADDNHLAWLHACAIIMDVVDRSGNMFLREDAVLAILKSLKWSIAFIFAASIVFAPFAAAPAAAQITSPATWYVSNTGDDANTCLTTDAPCATINGAIGKAAAGDTVEVAVGTYTGSGNQVVLIDKDITLSGGWDETFTSQSGLSIIDGEAARRGISVDYNSRSGDPTVSVDHFDIRNGS
ncbi:MAG TPA: hypothetical protein VMJ64_03220, partial [Anaerolineales bacterium]|nr:hypothetical protein [Anaerolineales bacterium]